MRIAEIHIFRRDLPVVGGSFATARIHASTLDTTIVELVTDSGLSGYGETCPLGPVYQPAHAFGARAALQELAPHLLGMYPLQIGCVRRSMDHALAGHSYAKAAIDIALWDLAGKAYGARVCDLLGGATAEQIPTYYSIGVVPPEEAVQIATERQADGYRRIQLKVGGRPIQADIEAVRAVAAALDAGVALVVDANRGWTTRDTVMASEAWRDLPLVLEQPCDTLAEIATLRGRLHHPVYVDEAAEDLPTILRIVGEGLADGLGLKVTRVGGLSTMRAIRDVCEARNVPITSDDAWGGDIIAAACLHLGATVEPRLLEGVWVAAPYIDGHDDVDGGIAPQNGYLRLPNGHGLGITPDTSRWKAVASFG